MNFRKRVKILPGVKMNVSKSGVSFTVGGKGISANVGKKGLFLNTSIPGTGLYDRHKIADFEDVKNKIAGKKKTKKQVAVDTGSRAADVQPKIKPVEQAQVRPAEQREEEVIFADIMRLAADVPTADMYTGEAELPVEDAYMPAEFDEPRPSMADIRSRLEAEAEQNVQSIAFWSVAKKREEYVQDNLEAEYEKAYAQWNERKDAFEAEQEAIARKENARIQKENQRRMESLRRGIGADADYVEDEISAWLGEVDLPMEFDVEFEYDAAAGVLMADLDLPEIEDIPDEKEVVLASGAVRTKPKSQKELRDDYTRCVLGLGVYLASHFFCITPDMERILLSAYTQRRDNKTGDIQNEYIYSVIFDREAFEKDGYQEEEPEQFYSEFKSRMIRLSTGVMKKIEPYTAEDLQ